MAERTHKKTFSSKIHLDETLSLLVKSAESKQLKTILYPLTEENSSHMAKKILRRKKRDDAVPEQIPPLHGDRERFGAVAFFDSRTETGDDIEEAELSLDALREAFAVSQGRSVSLELNPTFGESRQSDDNEEVDEPVDDTEGTLDLNPGIILEAMLFVGNRENRPLTSQLASERMRNVTPDDIAAAVGELNQTYDRLGCPYRIVIERDGYKMVLRPEFEAIRENFYGKVREATLSQRAIDTLAIVAYRQPISAEEVQKLWEASSTATLSQLVRRGLLSTERQTRDKKKVVVYRTTERFLDIFNLTSLDDLPLSDEIS